jgi:hypothetical protein
MKRLREITLISAFESLPLKTRRALVPKLLESAKIISQAALPVFPDTTQKGDEFCKWLCRSSEKPTWTDDEVVEAWALWNFIYQRTLTGWTGPVVGGEFSPGFELDSSPTGENCWHDNPQGFHIFDEHYALIKTVTRREFFEEILKSSTPDHIDMNSDDGELFPSFSHAFTEMGLKKLYSKEWLFAKPDDWANIIEKSEF